MITLLALVILSTAAWYSLGMALISRPLWSRYPAWLDAWATCPACSGTWYAAGAYVALWRAQGAEILGIGGPWGIPVAAACGMVLTPLLAALLIRALAVAGVWTRADPPTEDC